MSKKLKIEINLKKRLLFLEMKRDIKKTPYYSYKIGYLPEGCKLCVKGEKLVLFITGICNRKCFYCPLSDKKKGKDVLYANEWNTKLEDKLTKRQIDIILKESELCDAKGAGITGGDPLLVINRTVLVIKKLKKYFGKKFHIHLYTSFENVTREKLALLYKAGLDEIRFHPLIWDNSLWSRINLAREFKWYVGVEIPSIPDYEKQTRGLIDFFNGKIDFLNINELEIADSNVNHLINRGYKAKDFLPYAVLGSEKIALKLMKYCINKNYKFNVYYCTCRLKDRVQMARRIKKRAKNVAYKFDCITREGMFFRGVIYIKEVLPSFSYRDIVNNINKNKRKFIINKLNKIKKNIIEDFNLKTDDIIVDDYKLRLLADSELVRKLKNELKNKNLIPALVEEYPTKDAIEIEIDFL